MGVVVGEEASVYTCGSGGGGGGKCVHVGVVVGEEASVYMWEWWYTWEW